MPNSASQRSLYLWPLLVLIAMLLLTYLVGQEAERLLQTDRGASSVANGILYLGLLISLLVSTLAYVLLRNQRRLAATTRRMTHDLDTSQHELSASLRELQFFRLALDEHAIVSIADARGNIVFVNDKFIEVSGYSREELLGQNHRMLKSGIHPPAFYDALWDTITHGKVWQGEVCNQRKNGEYYWVRATIMPLLDAGGLPERYISIRTDITEIKQAESRWAFAVEGAGDGVWDWNMRTGEMPLSGFYEEMLGYRKGELEPTIDAWLKSVHPQDMARVQSNLQAYLDGKIPTYTVELRLRNQQGNYTWILCRGTVVERAADGTPTRMIGIHSNIDQRKKADEQLALAREQAVQANQAKTEFLTNMSHELRTPMNAILGFAQLLQTADQCTGEQREHVAQILEAGWHLQKLIDEMLDLASVESGHLQLHIESLPPVPLLAECVSMMSPLAVQKGLRIENLSHEPIPQVLADPLRLKQVLLNLLSNAIKYNQPQGKISLETRVGPAGSVLFSVRDTGRGMSEEELRQLFHPFTRFGDTRSVSGTGNGLAISKKLVESMGGEISVTSTRNIGSEFLVRLPISNGKTASSAPSDQLALLYIEDDLSQRTLIGAWASKKGWHISFASDGTSGIDMATQRQFDAILLDIELSGGFDGFDVKSVLADVSALRHIPVIGISVHREQEYAERATQAGFAAYFSKPVDLPLLEHTLKRLTKINLSN